MKRVGTRLRVFRRSLSDAGWLTLALLDLANGGDWPRRFRAGIYRDRRGAIVLHALRQSLVGARSVRRVRHDAQRLLLAATRGAGALEAALNARGVRAGLASPTRTRPWPLVRPSAPPGRLVPTVRSAQDWPSGVLAAALLEPVGRQDVLGNRIARCERCSRFHLLPTGRPSRFCSRRCRKQTG